MMTIVKQLARALGWGAGRAVIVENSNSEPGIYQVWHENGWPMRRALFQMGDAPEPIFPQDYTHVANVTAHSLDQVWEIIKDKGDIADSPDNWHCWEKNPAVDVLAKIDRSTSGADVVIGPDWCGHYAGTKGFNYGNNTGQKNDFYLLDVLCVMGMARDRHRQEKPNV